MGKAILRLVECKNCGRVFSARQNNPKNIPRHCRECKEHGGKCRACSKAIRVARKFCSKRCAEASPVAVRGHKVQGTKLIGKNNPMADERWREKVSVGVKESYNRNPRLRLLRALTPKGFLLAGRYDDGCGNRLKSSLELQTALALQRGGLEYTYEAQLITDSGVFYPDFTIGNSLVEVCGWVGSKKDVNRYLGRIKYFLKHTRFHVVVITYPEVARVFLPLQRVRHFDVLTFPGRPIVQELVIEDLGNVDYTHTLPFHEGKCRQIHSHSSYGVGIRVEGTINKTVGMVLDYKDLKQVVKDVLSKYDHKFIIGKKYVQDEGGASLKMEYDTLDGHYTYEIPRNNVVLVDPEATLEVITREIAQDLDRAFPPNISHFEFFMREGMGGGCVVHMDRELRSLDVLPKMLKYHEQVSP